MKLLHKSSKLASFQASSQDFQTIATAWFHFQQSNFSTSIKNIDAAISKVVVHSRQKL
ncbi:hypothetical protein Mapa_014484 [Marchantia paleacea]|nr:hypothetical protein Mapa_014484 [Marchantia paleacea]